MKLDRATTIRWIQERDIDRLAAFLMSGLHHGKPGAPAAVKIGVVGLIHEHCDRAEQLTGRERVPVGPEVLEAAQCDAVHIGAVDVPGITRAYQTLTPATKRKVMARDGGQCRVTGCCNSRYLEFHHLEHQHSGARRGV